MFRGMFEKRIAIVASLLFLVGLIVLCVPPSSSSPSSSSPSSSSLASSSSSASRPPPSTFSGNHGDAATPAMQLFAPSAGGSFGSSACESKLCGCAIANQFGLKFNILVAKKSVQRAHDGGFHHRIIVQQIAGNTTDLSWSARAVSDSVLAGAAPSTSRFMFPKNSALAEWEFDFWFPAVAVPLSYDIEITLTWINDRITGAKWILPSRDDNPPLAEKKRKCTALQLVGDCDRFGIPVFLSALTVPASSSSSPSSSLLSSSSNQQQERPPCRTVEQLAGVGAWHRVPDQELSQLSGEEKELLDDFVGLNRFRGGVWRWQPRQCALRWFRRSEAVSELLVKKKLRQITLFGDSMMLEQFLNLRRILQPDSVIRSARQQKLRTMSFFVRGGGAGGGDEKASIPPTLTVTFLRSYTTSGGHSVIASPAVVAAQVLATRPDIIVGNAAVLHWQQNMRSLSAWTDNIRSIAKKLCHERVVVADTASATAAPNLFYWGPTLIQMGRTQGLQPQRTMEFARTAQDAFDSECGGRAPARASASSSSSSSPEGSNHRRKAATFWTYNASIARRESAHDGQHWACYREFGGVAATFAQMFLNVLLA